MVNGDDEDSEILLPMVQIYSFEATGTSYIVLPSACQRSRLRRIQHPNTDVTKMHLR